jgi:NTE family protein
MSPPRMTLSSPGTQAMAAPTIGHSLTAVQSRGASRPRTAFVLSGGASLGAVQVGMLQALYESGIAPDLLVGTSAGALNAAFIASRPPTPATAGALGRVWRDLRREDIFPVSLSALVGGLCGRRDHLVPDHGLRRLIGRHIEFADLADAPTPLHVVAFDLTEERELMFSQGPVADLVMAAASIPGVFPPVVIGGRRLIDGGVVNNTPISRAVELGAERIYVLPTQDPSSRRTQSAPQSALDAAICGVRVLIDSRLDADLVRYAAEAELIVLPAPNADRVQPTNFDHAARLMIDAHGAARAVLARHGVRGQLRLVG